MKSLTGTLVHLAIGYLVGLWLAAPGLFSWTLSATQWTNVTVYLYMIFWPFILAFHFIIWAILIVAIVVVIAVALDKLNVI